MAWYENRNLVEFLSDIGRHFRMGHMLAKHRYMHCFLYLTNLGFVLTEVFADVKFCHYNNEDFVYERSQNFIGKREGFFFCFFFCFF